MRHRPARPLAAHNSHPPTAIAASRRGALRAARRRPPTGLDGARERQLVSLPRTVGDVSAGAQQGGGGALFTQRDVRLLQQICSVSALAPHSPPAHTPAAQRRHAEKAAVPSAEKPREPQELALEVDQELYFISF